MTVTLEQIKQKQAELESMIKSFEEQEEAEFPKDNDLFYYIKIHGEISSGHFISGGSDEKIALIGNCFRTQEEAEFAVECLKVLVELKKCGGKIEYKRYTLEGKDFFISYLDGEILVHSIDSFWGDWKMWFPTEEAAQKAIDTIGEERLLKYWFNVEV